MWNRSLHWMIRDTGYSGNSADFIQQTKSRTPYSPAFYSFVFCFTYLFLPQQFLYFFPLPQGQGSFLPTVFSFTNVFSLWNAFVIA